MNLTERAKEAKAAGRAKARDLCIGPHIRNIAFYEGGGPHLFHTSLELANGRYLRLTTSRHTGMDSTRAEVATLNDEGADPAILVYDEDEQYGITTFRPGPWIDDLLNHARIAKAKEDAEIRSCAMALAKATIIAFSPIKTGGAT